ncbi:colicin uptake protein [Limnofasciculus baicalensis]|uniref:Colicin uptake protein n=1 Tax=Limnofasciculus baicalensis BBK-W-15 TaxID=2699891 RepID=A0AAE3KN37_9CYAN|nr:colicin uptake protein [Limnofasciculus baicalensis]MCP2729421.1 colicin uptake protein [Limnofasciculus baicalensis BBK-W-15]
MNTTERKPESTTTSSGIIRLKPQQFIHVLDNNTGVTRLEVGPQTITLRDHERLILKPEPMIVVPPRYYCIVANPVLRDEANQPIADGHGQIKLRYGDREIRFAQEPFPLYPDEELIGEITQLHVVERNQALRLKAIRDFSDPIIVNIDGEDRPQTINRLAGDEWLFEGPGTYIPRVEVQVSATTKAIVIKTNQALRLIARQNCIDRTGNRRRAGEEWLLREEGAYLPGIDEEFIGIINAYVLTERKALHLRAKRTFTDILNRQRKAGDEWLVTLDDAEIHIPDVYEEVVGEVEITTLGDREWCIVLNPVDNSGKPQLGMREVRQGRISFFLHPGESLEEGIQQVYVLGEQEALLLKAKEALSEGEGTNLIQRQPGDMWMIGGPRDYIPRVEIEVIEKRQAIPLDKNEGIYVRDVQTGELKLVSGPQAYMLSPYEELWEKELSPVVEELLDQKIDPVSDRGRHFMKEKNREKPELVTPTISQEVSLRDKTRAVVFHIPQNAAVQIHDYKERTAKTVFGPDLVMLGPDEAFTVLSLSGGVPKRAHRIKSLALLLGPDFMTDLFAVETSDHARLQLRLSYNWYFDVDRHDEQVAAKLFQVPDFVDTACKAIASRVRGAVAGEKFDEFHRNSARIIRAAVFGTDEQDHIREELRFKTNNLVITNVDIQSVEPVDERTLESLQKSVQIAIQITTDAQEAAARQDAERIEQTAKAKLERQVIVDQSAAEVERKKLLEFKAENAAIEATGKAAAEAKAKAESARIQGELTVNLAQQEADAARIRYETELAQLTARQEAELAHQQAISALEIEKAERMSQITSVEFQQKIAAIGAETIIAIAQAGPEMQVRLLEALGIQSVLITDGKNPINLFGTANGLIAPMTSSLSSGENLKNS